VVVAVIAQAAYVVTQHVGCTAAGHHVLLSPSCSRSEGGSLIKHKVSAKLIAHVNPDDRSAGGSGPVRRNTRACGGPGISVH
jgi:hypothetical protein